jgi:hypothetical protein
MRKTGHVARKEKKNVHSILFGTSQENISLSRPRSNCKDNIGLLFYLANIVYHFPSLHDWTCERVLSGQPFISEPIGSDENIGQIK